MSEDACDNFPRSILLHDYKNKSNIYRAFVVCQGLEMLPCLNSLIFCCPLVKEEILLLSSSGDTEVKALAKMWLPDVVGPTFVLLPVVNGRNG